MAETPMYIEANIKSPCIALKMDKQPNSKFAEVIALGICCFKTFIVNYKFYKLIPYL